MGLNFRVLNNRHLFNDDIEYNKYNKNSPSNESLIQIDDTYEYERLINCFQESPESDVELDLVYDVPKGIKKAVLKEKGFLEFSKDYYKSIGYKSKEETIPQFFFKNLSNTTLLIERLEATLFELEKDYLDVRKKVKFLFSVVAFKLKPNQKSAVFKKNMNDIKKLIISEDSNVEGDISQEVELILDRSNFNQSSKYHFINELKYLSKRRKQLLTEIYTYYMRYSSLCSGKILLYKYDRLEDLIDDTIKQVIDDICNSATTYSHFYQLFFEKYVSIKKDGTTFKSRSRLIKEIRKDISISYGLNHKSIPSRQSIEPQIRKFDSRVQQYFV